MLVETRNKVENMEEQLKALMELMTEMKFGQQVWKADMKKTRTIESRYKTANKELTAEFQSNQKVEALDNRMKEDIRVLDIKVEKKIKLLEHEYK